MASKLKQAVEIYKSLGYEEASIDTVMELGLGSKEEQKIAREGLKSGEWTEIKQLSENSYGVVKVADVEEVDLEKLALFAIRIGVDAKRAASLIRGNNEAAFLVISERGKKYAADFIAAVCRSDRRAWEHSSSVFGMLCVHLVHRMELEIPQSTEYIKDWAVYAASALRIMKSERRFDLDFAPGEEMIRSRFAEHIEVGIAINAPATGPFSAVLIEGVKQEMIPKDHAKELVFFALNASNRPGDRKAWMNALEKIGLTDRDILAQGESLIPLLSLGESAVTERFAPVLIEHSSDELLPSILVSASASRAKKIRQLVLKSALGRAKPHSADELTDWLALHIHDGDKSIAKLAQRLADAWAVELEPTEEEASEELRGLWQKTPSLWSVPSFDPGEVSPEKLTELAAELSKRKANAADITEEKFLAMANELARRDPKEARLSLVGIRTSEVGAAYLLGAWAKNKEIYMQIDKERKRFENGVEVLKKDYTDLMRARNFVICTNIDKLPCLLSTPSRMDLSITVGDLADRLLKYQEEKCTFVWEPDLQLALTRLDIHGATEEARSRLKKVKLFIRLPDGEKIRNEQGTPLLAGELVLAYLADPHVEPHFEPQRYYWGINLGMPKSLRDFPNRFGYMHGSFFSIFPHWGDFALTCVRRDTEVYHEQGIVMRQVARRKEPLPGGALMNLLAAQSYLSDETAEDVITATVKAWERGLLIPGTAAIRYLDWRGGELSNLASLAESLDHIAQDGILSVVWPVADELIDESLNAPRMIPGTAELAKLIRKYLDEVLDAVKKGIAPSSALTLKGVRRLAQKSGTSIAVTTAKEVVEHLNASDFVKQNEELQKAAGQASTKREKADKTDGKRDAETDDFPMPAAAFDETWRACAEERPIIEDGITMRIKTLDTDRSVKPLVFGWQLPDIPDREYHVIISGWMYGLDNEGQTRAVEAPRGSDYAREGRSEVWLHWDESEQKMKVSEFRNWRSEVNGPLDGESAPLSAAMLTTIVGLLAQDGDAVYSSRASVRRLVKSGELGVAMLRRATRTLLSHESVSPAKLVRVLEKEAELLPVFWVMLTECIRAAGEKTEADKKPPTWVNRVLDICIYHARYLKEAAKRGLIPPEDAQWIGLDKLASCKAKSAAVQKAKKLADFLNA